jgi:nickel-dependent lactate racemase
MVEVWIPYGETEICADIPTENYLGKVEPKPKPQVSQSLEEMASEAFRKPLGNLSLKELVKPQDTVAILVDELTGKLHLKALASKLLNELEAGGVEPSNVTFIFGRGLEKPYEAEEVRGLLGEISEKYQFKIHNPHDSSLELAEVGSTSRKVKVFLRRDFMNFDVKIVLGVVKPHSYAGYSGLGQTVLSAAGSLRNLTRSYTLYGNLDSRVGKLEGNPLQQELLEISNIAKLSYGVHVVCHWDGSPVKVFAGRPEETFKAAVKFFEETFSSRIEGKARLVIVSPGGSPYDSSFENAYDALECAVEAVEDGGGIILAAECVKEKIDSKFLLWLQEAKSPEKAEEVFKQKFEYGFHRVVRLRKLQKKFRIHMVTGLPETIVSKLIGFRVHRALDDAFQSAFRGVGKGGILVIPSALQTLPKVKQPTIE